MTTNSKSTDNGLSSKAIAAFLRDPDLAILALHSLTIGHKAVAP